ncbi:helix-turn-helix domain-containing protein [Nocardia thraciensis]
MRQLSEFERDGRARHLSLRTPRARAAFRVGARLRVLRIESGRTATDFARLLGWPNETISRIEHGTRPPTPAEITAWCRCTGATADTCTALIALADTAISNHHRGWHARRGRYR